MGRGNNESYLDFKKRMIDPISESYCSAKWYNATIWLGHGQTTSCHHPPAHKIDVEEIKSNPSAIHNTKHKKLMRKYMQEGVRPEECEYCWKIEDIGKNTISDRAYKTEIYSDEDIIAAGEMNWESDVQLRTLEISFDRTCNFACSYCNPAFSTTWVKDIKKFGAYRNIVSDGRGHFIDTAPYAEGYKVEEENPYIQAFWKWWEDGLADNLEEIRVTGGEPLMAASVWKLFDWFKDNPSRNPRMRFAINTNLVPKKNETLTKLIEKTQHVPNFSLYTSNESAGKHSEYIRDGMIYEKWKNNIERLLTEGNIKNLHIMMTINGLCLASITEFMDDMFEFKRRFGFRYPTLSLNLLRFPSFQSPAILPQNIKDKARENLEVWLANKIENNERDSNNNKLLTDMEKAHVERLIDYLDSVKQPHRNTADSDKLYNDFKAFYHQYDVRRGKNFRETFPKEFVDFYDSIDVPVPTEKEIKSNVYRQDLDKIRVSDGDPASDRDYDG